MARTRTRAENRQPIEQRVLAALRHVWSYGPLAGADFRQAFSVHAAQPFRAPKEKGFKTKVLKPLRL